MSRRNLVTLSTRRNNQRFATFVLEEAGGCRPHLEGHSDEKGAEYAYHKLPHIHREVSAFSIYVAPDQNDETIEENITRGWIAWLIGMGPRIRHYNTSVVAANYQDGVR
jgi:hypothetical protein